MQREANDQITNAKVIIIGHLLVLCFPTESVHLDLILKSSRQIIKISPIVYGRDVENGERGGAHGTPPLHFVFVGSLADGAHSTIFLRDCIIDVSASSEKGTEVVNLSCDLIFLSLFVLGPISCYLFRDRAAHSTGELLEEGEESGFVLQCICCDGRPTTHFEYVIVSGIFC